MKLKIECVRDVMLELESFPIGCYNAASFEKSVAEHGEESVLYTLAKLVEAKYINAEYKRTIGGQPYINNVFDLTFAGHEFLETIRENKVWNKTKNILGKVGSGSFALVSQVASTILTDLASAYIKGQS